MQDSMDDPEEQNKIINLLTKPLKKQLLVEANKIVLVDSPIFQQNFSSKVIHKTVQLIKQYKCSPEQVIFSRDEMGFDNIYFIETGSVEVCLELHPQKDQKHFHGVQSLLHLRQGEYFGAYSFFTGVAQTYTIRSREFTTLLYIKRDEFVELLQQFPDDYENFCYIQDNIKLYKNIQKIQLKCISCNSTFHMIQDCPLLHFVPNTQHIINIHCYSQDQLRTSHNRNQQTKKQALKFNERIIADLLKFQDKHEEVLDEYEFQHGLIEDGDDEETSSLNSSQQLHISNSGSSSPQSSSSSSSSPHSSIHPPKSSQKLQNKLNESHIVQSQTFYNNSVNAHHLTGGTPPPHGQNQTEDQVPPTATTNLGDIVINTLLSDFNKIASSQHNIEIIPQQQLQQNQLNVLDKSLICFDNFQDLQLSQINEDEEHKSNTSPNQSPCNNAITFVNKNSRIILNPVPKDEITFNTAFTETINANANPHVIERPETFDEVKEKEQEELIPVPVHNAHKHQQIQQQQQQSSALRSPQLNAMTSNHNIQHSSKDIHRKIDMKLSQSVNPLQVYQETAKRKLQKQQQIRRNSSIQHIELQPDFLNKFKRNNMLASLEYKKKNSLNNADQQITATPQMNTNINTRGNSNNKRQTILNNLRQINMQDMETLFAKPTNNIAGFGQTDKKPVTVLQHQQSLANIQDIKEIIKNNLNYYIKEQQKISGFTTELKDIILNYDKHFEVMKKFQIYFVHNNYDQVLINIQRKAGQNHKHTFQKRKSITQMKQRSSKQKRSFLVKSGSRHPIQQFQSNIINSNSNQIVASQFSNNFSSNPNPNLNTYQNPNLNYNINNQ